MKPVQGYEFIVEGSGEFPFDMLRYDRCWPTVESETSRFNPLGRIAYATPRQITLRGLREPTDARWESFNWKIVKFDRIGIGINV